MAQIGFKASLKANDGGTGAAPGGASTAFPGAVLITLPKRERGEQESTKHDQADDTKAFISTLIDGGVLKCEMQYSHAQFTRINLMFDNGDDYEWVATAPLGSAAGTVTAQAITYPGFVKSVDEMPFEKEGIMTQKFEVRITGKPTIGAGSNSPPPPP